MRRLSLNAVYGRSTLPASFNAGKPSTPVTDSVGFQVRLTSASTGSVVVGSVGPPSAPHAHGKRFQTSSPRIFAVAFACSTRSAGIAQWKLSGSRRPVFESSRRSSTWRRMRKLDGTRPLASPECTPSVRISTLSVPVMLPRRLVVSQSWS